MDDYYWLTFYINLKSNYLLPSLPSLPLSLPSFLPPSLPPSLPSLHYYFSPCCFPILFLVFLPFHNCLVLSLLLSTFLPLFPCLMVLVLVPW